MYEWTSLMCPLVYLIFRTAKGADRFLGDVSSDFCGSHSTYNSDWVMYGCWDIINIKVFTNKDDAVFGKDFFIVIPSSLVSYWICYPSHKWAARLRNRRWNSGSIRVTKTHCSVWSTHDFDHYISDSFLHCNKILRRTNIKNLKRHKMINIYFTFIEIKYSDK